jgi:hypothetical protein
MWTSAKEGIIMRNVVEENDAGRELRKGLTILVTITARSG